ncbi:putative membrane protein, partial [Vibrio harveyi]
MHCYILAWASYYCLPAMFLSMDF